MSIQIYTTKRECPLPTANTGDLSNNSAAMEVADIQPPLSSHCLTIVLSYYVVETTDNDAKDWSTGKLLDSSRGIDKTVWK